MLSSANFGKQMNDIQRTKCGLKRVILLEAYFAQLVEGIVENEAWQVQGVFMSLNHWRTCSDSDTAARLSSQFFYVRCHTET